MRTVRHATIDLLRHHGLKTWFGNPGSSELALLDDFPSDFRYLLGLQEMVPVGMADGFSQVTGRPALVNVHTAPGLGNAMGALYNAYLNKTPLIVIAGNQRRAMQNQKWLLTNEDAVVVPRPFVKWSVEPATASVVPAVLARAIHVAMAPPTGPVFVSLPMDDMAYELNDAEVAEIDVIRDRKVTYAGGFRQDLARKIAGRLSAAKSPAFVVHGDLEHAGAWNPVVKLAERSKAAVWTAPLPGLSGFPENHPLYQGMLPPGTGWISEALKGHDLVVAMGGPVFRYYPYIRGPYLPEGTSLIHITSDPDEAARAPVGEADGGRHPSRGGRLCWADLRIVAHVPSGPTRRTASGAGRSPDAGSGSVDRRRTRRPGERPVRQRSRFQRGPDHGIRAARRRPVPPVRCRRRPRVRAAGRCRRPGRRPDRP